MPKSQAISGQIVDLIHRVIYPGTLVIHNGQIKRIVREDTPFETFLLPGLVDAHIHIESSMLVPTEFARLAVTHGTVATVSDPHEITNVMGSKGIDYLIANSRLTPFKFYFGVPSAVPATHFETSGATLGPAEVEAWFQSGKLRFLGEVMNVPGVLASDPDLLAKIASARRRHYPVDGHAPQLSGPALTRYIQAGISTDHETSTLDEAFAKIHQGMQIQIREGSAAQNFSALHPLLASHPASCMFCSDDRHPDALARGHINELVRRALQLGYDPFAVLQCASLNPIRHYQLDVGLLQPGDPADFIAVNDLHEFQVLKTYIAGKLVAQQGRSLLPEVPVEVVNHFQARLKKPEDFAVAAEENTPVNALEVIDGQLLTGWNRIAPRVVAGWAVSDPARDLIKLTVVDRYRDAPPAIGFVQRFDLQSGAIAASVAHDSHHIIAAGVTDADIATAVNLVIQHQGGLAVVDDSRQAVLPLPIAGLMSNQDGWTVARHYTELLQFVQTLGSPLRDPFMTLSFLSLPVIPRLKLTTKGLIDVENFKTIELFEN